MLGATFGRSKLGYGALGFVEVSAATELIFERAGYCRISKAPSNAMATILIPSSASGHCFNAPRAVPLVYDVELSAEAPFRHDHLHMMRKISLVGFGAGAAFVAGHGNSG
jgi:hypothetical protein